MPKIIKRENEELDSMLRRFKKMTRDSGVLEECRKREFFVKKSLKLKLKSERARIKNRKKK